MRSALIIHVRDWRLAEAVEAHARRARLPVRDVAADLMRAGLGMTTPPPAPAPPDPWDAVLARLDARDVTMREALRAVGDIGRAAEMRAGRALRRTGRERVRLATGARVYVYRLPDAAP